MTDNEQKTFPLEKILTVSVGDYVDNMGARRSSDYDMVGVHVMNSYPHPGGVTPFDNIYLAFAKKVPENAEVVVNFKTNVSLHSSAVYTASGTALIPRK